MQSLSLAKDYFVETCALYPYCHSERSEKSRGWVAALSRPHTIICLSRDRSTLTNYPPSLYDF